MTKTFCDKCGAECVYYVLSVYGNATHRTADGTFAGEDDLRTKHYCRTCADKLAAEWGFKFSPDPGMSDQISSVPVPG